MGLMRRMGSKLTYSNVVATLALVLALGGGSFAVAAALKKNSVGSKQIKAKAVRTGDIADNAVTGAKINVASIGSVPEATEALNVLSAVVKADGTLTQATQDGTISAKIAPGTYTVDFGRPVTACTSVATIGNVSPPNPPNTPPALPPNIPEPGFIGTSNTPGNDEAIRVVTRSQNDPFNPEDRSFELVVVC